MPIWSAALRPLLAASWAGAALLLTSCSPSPERGPGEPAIWRIADEDSEIWLFGTVHVLPPELEWRGQRLEAAFAAAEELVTETDAALAQDAYTALVDRHGRLPLGQTLAAALDEPGLARLRQVSRGLGIDPAQIETLRPWFAALQLSFAYAGQHGHTPQAGVETVLVAEAHARGMRLSYLETPEAQIQALAGLAPEDEARFLDTTVRQIAEDGANALDATDAAWARGDVETLTEVLETQLREAGPGVYEAIIVRRNRAWTDEIERRLAGSGRIFYAVGAAHLVGEQSVVALLRARGVTVAGP